MSISRIYRSFRKLLKALHPDHKQLPWGFDYDKKDLIDYVFLQNQQAPLSFADLGGVWGVDGAYTFYILDTYGIDSAVLVDFYLTDNVNKKSVSYSNLRLVCGNFGDQEIVQQVGNVDAILLFDVLLHQVKPDWNQILEIYSHHTKYFIIFNEQWIGSDSTVRLFDLGSDEYFKNVPHKPDTPIYKELFEKMYEFHPYYNRIWRDITNVWQWGITDQDLIQTINSMGFKLLFKINYGKFKNLKNFEKHGFIFQRVSKD
jgi:hypothetical protein